MASTSNRSLSSPVFNQQFGNPHIVSILKMKGNKTDLCSELYSQHCHSQALCPLIFTTVCVNLYHKTDSIGRVTGS